MSETNHPTFFDRLRVRIFTIQVKMWTRLILAYTWLLKQRNRVRYWQAERRQTKARMDTLRAIMEKYFEDHTQAEFEATLVQIGCPLLSDTGGVRSYGFPPENPDNCTISIGRTPRSVWDRVSTAVRRIEKVSFRIVRRP